MAENLDQLPMTFSYHEARAQGVSKRQLYRWRDEGAVEPLGRGLYRRADVSLADTDLIEIAHRAPEATLCLTSALVRHGLSDAIPASHDVALPRGRRAPAVSIPVTWHRFDPATFEIGRKITALDDQTAIGLYDATRSLVDALRLAPQHGSEIAYEALRRWLHGGGAPADLLEVAKHFPRTLPRLRTALDVLL
jgi:predicted transcriptional regulator of viral defense system